MTPKICSSGRASLLQQKGKNKARLQSKGNMTQLGPRDKLQMPLRGAETEKGPHLTADQDRLGVRVLIFRDTAERGRNICISLVLRVVLFNI